MRVYMHCLNCLAQTQENPKEHARLEVELEFEEHAETGVLKIHCVRCNRAVRSFPIVIPSEIRDLPERVSEITTMRPGFDSKKLN